MNVKKRLEQEANATHQKILEESDKSFLFSLQEQVSEPKCRPVFSHWRVWLTGAACTLAAALVIVCAVLFIPSKQVVYWEKDFHTSASDVPALNADLKDFELVIGEDLIVTDIKKTIDGPSGDLLFYVITLQTSDNRIQISSTIVCNQNYSYDSFPPNLSFQQVQLTDYSVIYNIESSVNSAFQCYDINAYAKIEGANEIIYITRYQEIALDENGTLFEFIESLVQLKH